MVDGKAQVRYYDGRGRRRWLAPLVVLVLLVGIGAGFGAWMVTAGSGAGAGVGELPTSPLPEGTPRPPATPPQTVSEDDTSVSSVAMIGDSITEGSEAELRYVLAAVGMQTVDVEGLSSRRIEVGGGRGEPESGMQALDRMLAAGVDPEVWVVALGTNDVGQYGDAEEYRRLIRGVLDGLPEDTPVVWVDVYRFDRLEATDAFNRVLREEIEARDDATVVSWFDQASTRGEEVLSDDQVHPDKEGRVAFALLVAQGIAEVT